MAFLRLLRRCCGRSINVLEDLDRTSAQQRFTNPLAEPHRVVTALLFAQNFRSIRTRHNRGQPQHTIAHFGERSDGDLTSAPQLVQQRSLACRRRARRRVVEERQVLAHCNIAFADLDPKRALSGRGTHETLREDFSHPLSFAQTRQASRSQNDGLVLAFFKLAHASVNIAPQRMNRQVGPRCLQLSLPPQAAGAHTRTLRQCFDAVVLHRQKHVARVDPRGDCNQFESRREFGGQVFQAVHREVDAPFAERLFDLFGEHAFGADLGECYVSNLVASRLYDLDFHFVTALAQQRRDVVGLPECELRSARSNSEAHHQFCAPGFPLLARSCAAAALLASRNPNSLRTRSITVVASVDSRAAVLSVVMGVCMILFMMPRVSASTASSCSGVIAPSRPRTRSISAWRTVSRCSCNETMVGTTSSVCKRDWNLSTSSCTMASARSASVLRSAMCDETTCCKSSMSYTKMPSSLFMSGSISRGTAISIKNMGRFLRRLRNFSPCSLRKIACGAPVELITMSAFGTVS